LTDDRSLDAAASGAGAWPPFTFAFQPIVDASAGTAYSYEALIRGTQRESAFSVLGRVPREDLHRFDAAGRLVAIELAARLGLKHKLNLNCLPLSLLVRPPSETIEAARRAGLAPSQLILEVTEEEIISDHGRFDEVIAGYRAAGISTAVDDFGAGYAGLNLLADFQPDILKIDLKLVRDVHHHGPRQAIVRGIVQVCADLGVDVVAEGVETVEEYRWLRRAGVTLLQGYLFAKPAFETLAPIEFTTW